MSFHVFFECSPLVGSWICAADVTDLKSAVRVDNVLVERSIFFEFSFSTLGSHLCFSVLMVFPIYRILLSLFNLGIGCFDRKK
ncbi:hypothetical protein J2X10_002850 [Pseudomonas peli]|nr:hypothetical protein [Pseudomonas peli]